MQTTRKKFILQELNRKGSVSVNEIVSKFNVSHMTARRDLADLEAEGYLIRNYGGAVKSQTVENLFMFSRRVNLKKKEKTAICKFTSQFINDNDTIFIDCGTTLFRLCKYIKSKNNLRVITNSLPVLSELINYPNISVSLLGGEVYPERKATYGAITERTIEEYHADKAFIGADGVSLKNGLSSYDEKEANITRKMASRADIVYLLCDSSKIEKDSYYIFTPLSIVDYLITDDGIERKLIRKYSSKGIKILVAK